MKQTGEYVFPKNYTTPQPVDEARGWGYLPAVGRATGAMTTAGLAALVTAQSELYEAGVLPRDKDLEARIVRGVADGMAWLGDEFSVERNPGGGGWLYYYLYGLERAGVLCQTEFFGEYAWYLFGAEYLVEQQSRDGSWTEERRGGGPEAVPEVDTAFALLFLKRGTVPVKVPPVQEAIVTQD